MKKIYTLLFISYFCLKLSAFGIYPHAPVVPVFGKPDTSARKHQPDSVGQQVLPQTDSAKMASGTNHPVRLITDLLIKDTTILIAPVNGGDTLKLPLAMLRADSTTLSIPVRQDSAGLSNQLTKKDSADDISATPNAAPGNFKILTSGLQLDSLKASVVAELVQRDNLRRQQRVNEQIKLAWVLKINDPDSLKSELKHAANDTLRALIFSHLADFYLNYDTVAGKKKQSVYENEAINYTLLAIQQYAAYNDSTGLRRSFDNLAKVYYSQRKYSQAKWFILQSNTLSRAKGDTSNIIASLLTLSSIKSEIKDYNLAMQDLNEALRLSINIHSPKTESQVLKNYALLYSRLKNYPKEAIILKRRDSLEESMRKAAEAQLALQKRRLDSLQSKKKVYTYNTRKLYKNSSSKKID